MVEQWLAMVGRRPTAPTPGDATTLFACRIRQHHATGKTPFVMVYGLEAKLPVYRLISIINDDEQNNITDRV